MNTQAYVTQASVENGFSVTLITNRWSPFDYSKVIGNHTDRKKAVRHRRYMNRYLRGNGK